MNQGKRVIIIGAGIGGIVAAGSLARKVFPSLENHTTISLQKYTTLMQG
jgi:cation diffusion facilitator CzcD-associated flavoprotein CzcO